MACWAARSVTGWSAGASAQPTPAGARSGSDSQTLAALGTASVDDGTAAAGFHANEKTVGAGAFDLGGLVSAFHDARDLIGETRNYRNKIQGAASTWTLKSIFFLLFFAGRAGFPRVALPCG
jgi:hypothetical protein